MPATTVFFFKDAVGRSPVVSWLEDLRRYDVAAYSKCVAVIDRLRTCGHELRRPITDYLRDGIHELRARKGHVNYRILYFFHGRNVAIVAHATTKEDVVPAADVERAISRRRLYELDPDTHTDSRDAP